MRRLDCKLWRGHRPERSGGAIKQKPISLALGRYRAVCSEQIQPEPTFIAITAKAQRTVVFILQRRSHGVRVSLNLLDSVSRNKKEATSFRTDPSVRDYVINRKAAFRKC